ncbi:MAG: hypothetical protein HY097_08680 [Nitrospinae bacterium]|nr:hypothetical protein [Nitrospinota bacterium]MBI3813455.1 hypothetical protein [Nitrospinota bacterium]
MKPFKKILITSIIILAISIPAVFLVKSEGSGIKDDIDYLYSLTRLLMFRYSVIDKLSEKEAAVLYQQKCYRKCHGEEVIRAAVLPPAGWIQVVDKMRMEKGVKMSGKEVDVITNYLKETYPVLQSTLPYKIVKQIHRLLWRNDIGYGDVYADIIYATPQYLKSISAPELIKKYDAENNMVFIISLNVHDGRLEHYSLDEMTFLRVNNKEYPANKGWELRFETGDNHHREGIVKFKKDIITENAEYFELIIRNMAVHHDRVFRWDLPIVYPEGI